MSLTAIGTASYNGYTFSAYAETVRMSASYKYDEAGRTIIYTEWTISIKDRVFPGGTTVDQQLDAIYAKLKGAQDAENAAKEKAYYAAEAKAGR